MTSPVFLIDDAPLSRFHKKLTLYSAGGPFLDGYALTIIGVALITMRPALDMSGAELGLTAAAALIGIFVGGAVFGYVTDKVGRQVMYLLDLAVLTLTSLASAFVGEVWQLVALRFLLGMAIGADYPIASSLLAEFVPSRHRGRLLGALFVVWAAGAAAAAGCGWALSHLGDDAWRYMLASPAVFGVATMAFRLGTPESPRWLLSQGRTEEADRICRRVWGDEARAADIREDPAPVGLPAVFRGVYLRRIVFIGVFYTAHVIPLFAVYSFGPDILAEIGIAPSNVYAAELIISSLFLVGGVPGLLLVDRVGRRPLLTWTFVVMTATFAFMALAPGAPPWLLFAALATYAVTSGACNFIEIIYPNELFPTAVRATATGVVVAISRIGSATSTFLLPLVLSGAGIGAVMWVMAAVNVAGLLVTLALGEETRGRPLADAASAPAERTLTGPVTTTRKRALS
ncbi:MFS transporter [Thermoactinospora rubra]|uniref:MFS transporter n=1 Tax=Thermoactinospora rubra TaxID=1088767 RepID=UPI000A120F16|nr:MFS transporter [Thermoactinospora rubra]